LLTGASGFVGRQVLKALAKKNIKVRAVVRDGRQHELANQEYVESIVVTKDLFAEDANWWANVCKGVDTVIHVAWYVEPGNYLQSDKNIDCLIGTLQLAKGAAYAGVKRFIGIGTCFEYDLTDGLLSIHTELKPLTPYAATKAAAFTALSKCLPKYGLEFAWCRLFYLYGEGEDERRLVSYLRSKLAAGEPAQLTNGNQVRDFLDVRDAGKEIVEISLGNQKGPVNICSGIPVTVRQLAEKIANEYDRLDLLQFGARLENMIDPPYVVGVKQSLKMSD
jgi:dTDP-6-deoxy-L-talose 4-dehydrogenase (NAD+)